MKLKYTNILYIYLVRKFEDISRSKYSQRDSNPRQPHYKYDALPLSYRSWFVWIDRLRSSVYTSNSLATYSGLKILKSVFVYSMVYEIHFVS